MKQCNNCLKLMISMLFVGSFLFNTLAQNANTIEKAIALYNQGNEAYDNGKYNDALFNFESSYRLYNHAEIAYAICQVSSLLYKFDVTEKYANLALNGAPVLSTDLKNDAWKLLKWAVEMQKSGTKYDGKADMPTPLRPSSSNPRKKLGKKVQLNGVYTIQQKVNGHYWDAYEYEEKDYTLVTRGRQNNDTQKWIIIPLGNDVYTIQQKSNHRYVDAHEYEEKDYALVTRGRQNNDTQKWIIIPRGDEVYTIQQKSNHRYVDAHESPQHDFAIVTRTAQNNDTQRWVIKKAN